MRNKKRDEGGGGAIDEVEELLRAAQDDVLLNLSLNSHIARSSSSSSDLDSDLSRRFHALKSRPAAAAPSQPQRPPSAPSSSSSSSPSPYPRQVDDELKAVLGDDLSARFAALRGSLYSSFSSSSSAAAAAAAAAATAAPAPVVGPSVEAEGRDRRETGDLKSRGEDDQKEEDEVEKLIQWAVDAARLDPSAPSDDDDGLDNGNDDSDDEDEDDESEDESERKKSK